MRRTILAALLMAAALAGRAEAETRWVVCYADQENPRAFEPYQLVVLDSDRHPPLRPLRDRGKTLLGYLSLGEVENHRPWFETVKGWGILGDENPNWPGSFYVDVRDRRWVKLVVEELVPAILHRGFDGIFLDTLDNPAFLEGADPGRWAGMTEAAARLVTAIRRNFPQIRLMQNRGFEILPRTAASLDYALGESVYAAWDFQAGAARLQSPDDFRYQVDALLAAKRLNPRLEVMALDYWDPTDADGLRRIYAAERAAGLSPYVSTVQLDRVVPEPKP